MSLRSDGNVNLSGKPDNIEEIKNLKSQIIEELKKIEQEKQKAGDPRIGQLSLSYYNGDWYRVNTLFKTKEYGGNQPEWGNNCNIFSDTEINKITTSFWFEKENKGCADSDKIVKKLERLFNCTLSTKKEELQKRFPDLIIKMRSYDNIMQGKGKYVSEIIFPDFATFEKYVKLAFADNLEKAKKYEARVVTIFATAKTTGEKQKLESYTADCNSSDEECSCDLITVYALPDGTTETERIHTY